MTLFRRDACRADPGGRWVKPAQCIFVDPDRDDKIAALPLPIAFERAARGRASGARA